MLTNINHIKILTTGILCSLLKMRPNFVFFFVKYVYNYRTFWVNLEVFRLLLRFVMSEIGL